MADENAQDATTAKIAGIFATKTGKGDTVTKKMATTFKALTKKADFSENNDLQDEEQIENNTSPAEKVLLHNKDTEFHYNIQIHLNATKDISVYNAIFKSLKEHLL